MTDQLLNTFREYLLDFDEEKKETIINNLSENDLQIISSIKIAFLTDTHIDKIIKDFSLTQFQDEIKDLHAEFYLELAELYAEGKTNKEIETLLSSDNQNFKKSVILFSNETAFLKELSIAMDDVQTEKLIKGYTKIDEWLESKKQSQRAAANVIPFRKIITQFSIAAAVIGVLISGYYFNSLNKEELIDNPIVANIDIPKLIESTESKKTVIVEESSGRGFAKNRSNYDSITIQQNGLSKQIDTLQAMFENLRIKDNKQADSIQSKIIGQIDSLQILLNTYTFNSDSKKAVLNLPKVTVIENIISIDLKDLSTFYIKIQGKYYLIETNSKPAKLVPLKDKTLVEKLQTIEFLN
jgi:hypothetical protein